MAKLPSAFNSNDHEDMRDYSVVPAGEYVGQIVKSSLESCSSNAKDPNGKYIKLQVKLLNPQAKGKMVFTNLNIINKNEEAVRIANNELATICKACGKAGIKDTEELHGIPMKLKLTIEKGKNGNPDQNRIQFYEPLEGGVPKTEPVTEGEPAKPKMPCE